SFASLLAASLLVLAARPVYAQPLSLFRNYVVTGDYQIAGVGIRGLGVNDPATAAIVGGANTFYAPGTINMTGVPDNADILAAFVYWMSIESTDAPSSTDGTFRGVHIHGKLLGPEAINPNNTVQGCWSSGGGNGTTQGASHLRVYRADVLSLLPYPTNANGVPTGKRQANGPHAVRLPDSGQGRRQSPSSHNPMGPT